MAENKDQKRYVMVGDPDRNIYMFEEEEFNENFELDAVNPRQCRSRNSPSHKDRWDSFLYNNELAHAKSWFHYGKYPRHCRLLPIPPRMNMEVSYANIKVIR